MKYKVQGYHLNELQILEHFMEMEKRFERNTKRPFFPSLDYFLDDDKDKLSLLKTQVENMTYYVGLGSIPNRIKIEKLKDAAACINVFETSFIDITISEDVFSKNEFDKIFGTLAHEIGHKMLKNHGLYFNGLLDIENEIYADLSTFYLGFGKFVLRGFNIDGDSTKPLTGYLTPETYVMAYVLSEYLNGREPDTTALPNDIINMISTASAKCKSDWIKNATNEEENKKQYKVLSRPVGTTATILEIIEAILEKEYTNVRKFIYQLNQKCLLEANNVPLDCRKVAMAYAAFFKQDDLNSFLGERNLNDLVKLIALIIFERGYDIDKLLERIHHKCPNCGLSINNPSFRTEEGKRLYYIRCKRCQTQFVIDNNFSKIKRLIQKQISILNKPISDNQDSFFMDELSPTSIKRDKLNTVRGSNLIDKIRVYEKQLTDNKYQLESLQLENDDLKAKLSKWDSMNWWQRLWYRKKIDKANRVTIDGIG